MAFGVLGGAVGAMNPLGAHGSTLGGLSKRMVAARGNYSGTQLPDPVGDPNGQYNLHGGVAPIPPQMGMQPSAQPGATQPGTLGSFAPQSTTGAPGGYSTQGGPLAGFSAPGILAPFTQGHDLDPRRISESPGYQFLADQMTQGIDRSAASKGTLLTGGTLKDQMAHMAGLASQEYGNEWQRGFAQQGQNANIWDQNASRTMGGLSSVAGQGLGAAGGQADALVGGGNALAGGTRGGASAINQGIGIAANTLGEYFAKKRAQQPPLPPGTTPPYFPGARQSAQPA